MTEIYTASLRSEKRTLGLSKLSDGQAEAMYRLANLIEDGLRTSNDKDPHGTNRLIFLTGAKGSGKSTIVESLQYILTTRSGEPSSVPSSTSAIKTRLSDLITKNRDPWLPKLRWLPPLSLDALPQGANLAGAILSRIEFVVSRERETGVVHSGMFQTAARLEKVRHAIDTLKLDALVALEGNLEPASATMDPENFALRAGHAESTKIHLQNRLLAALSSFFSTGESGQSRDEGLFIQIIDDIDIRPSRAIEALDLAYTLSIPRMLYIFLGNWQSLDQVLSFTVQGEFGKVLPAKTTDAATRDVEASANETSSSLLRKKVPLAQRIAVDDFTLSEALGYHVTQIGDVTGTPRSTANLEEILCKVNDLGAGVLWSTQPNSFTLYDLITLDLCSNSMVNDLRMGERIEDKPRDPNGKVLSRGSPYDGVGFFESTPRHLADFYQLIAKSNSSSSDDLTGVFKEVFIRLIDEDGQLGTELQTKMREAVERSGSRWQISPPNMKAKAVRHGGVVISSDHNINLPHVRRDFALGSISHYDLELHPSGHSAPAAASLGLRTRTAFKLLHDVAIFSGVGIVSEQITIANPEELACTIWNDNISSPMRIPWSVIDWETFWHADHFAALWRQAVLRIRRIRIERSFGDADQVHIAGLLWICCLLETVCASKDSQKNTVKFGLSRYDGSQFEGQGGWILTPEFGGVSALSQHIIDEIGKVSERVKTKHTRGEIDSEYRHLLGAIYSIVYLASPEIGFGDDLAGIWREAHRALVYITVSPSRPNSDAGATPPTTRTPIANTARAKISKAKTAKEKTSAPNLPDATISTPSSPSVIPPYIPHINALRIRNANHYIVSPTMVRVMLDGWIHAKVRANDGEMDQESAINYRQGLLESDDLKRQIIACLGSRIHAARRLAGKYVCMSEVEIMARVYAEVEGERIKALSSSLISKRTE